jgi:VWFA-related protein
VVDVVVTDKQGQSVPGLRKDDFHVSEEGSPQILTSFEEHKGAAPKEMNLPSMPSNVFTNFPTARGADSVNVLLLDLLNTQPQNQAPDTKFDSKKDLRAGFERFTPASLAANKPFVERITQLAEKKKATTAQLSLAWLLAQKPFIVPIPGTGKVKHLQENVEAAKIELTAADLKEIDSALSEFKIHGGRMNAEQMQVVEA